MSIIWGKLNELLGEPSAEGPHAGVEIVESRWESKQRAVSAMEVACGEVPGAEAEWWRSAGVRVGHA